MLRKRTGIVKFGRSTPIQYPWGWLHIIPVFLDDHRIGRLVGSGVRSPLRYRLSLYHSTHNAYPHEGVDGRDKAKRAVRRVFRDATLPPR